MIINDFIVALHEDERMLAGKYVDEHGTDWNEYTLQKEKAGFGKFDQWFFMDYNDVQTQMKSKYKNRWGHRVANVRINDRKVDVQFQVGGNAKIEKKGQYEARDMLTDSAAAGKELVANILEPFLAAGHGINFKVEIDGQTRRGSQLIKVLEDKAKYSFKAFTVIWISQNFMVLTLHEDDNLLECE